jgi:hypothetical protein
MPCILCKYYQPTEPEDHRQLRESGQCESNCGKEWNNHTAVRYYKNHRKSLDGWCVLNPKPEPRRAGHVCAQIEIPEYFYNGNWGVERIDPDEFLLDWSHKQITNLCNGTWTSRRNDELEEQNVELRNQLTAVRKISASRLKRLQKIKDKPEPKTEPELPFRPHLVAAE